MQSFSLHPQLTNDCITLGKLSICQVLLFNGDTFPWFILVPQQQGSQVDEKNNQIKDNYIKEWHHLSAENQQAAFADSMQFSHFLDAEYTPDKINIASLGNMVPQLHIHHIARFKDDAAWPAPIWGHPNKGTAYSADAINKIKTQLTIHLKNTFTAH